MRRLGSLVSRIRHALRSLCLHDRVPFRIHERNLAQAGSGQKAAMSGGSESLAALGYRQLQARAKAAGVTERQPC